MSRTHDTPRPGAALPRWAKLARTHKENWARDHGHEDAPPYLYLEADGGPLAVVFLFAADRDYEMHLIQSAVFGLAPDAIVLVHETFVALRDPAHGDELQQGDLERIAARGGRDRGEVADAMQTIRCDRAGTLDGRTMPFQLAGRRVRWLEPLEEAGPGARWEGYVPENLVAIMTRPETACALALANPHCPADLNPERALQICRRTAIQFLTSQGCVVIPAIDLGPTPGAKGTS